MSADAPLLRYDRFGASGTPRSWLPLSQQHLLDPPPAKAPLWCRCGTDKTPIPCIGGCGYLCQLLPSKDPGNHPRAKRAVTTKRTTLL